MNTTPPGLIAYQRPAQLEQRPQTPAELAFVARNAQRRTQGGGEAWEQLTGTRIFHATAILELDAVIVARNRAEAKRAFLAYVEGHIDELLPENWLVQSNGDKRDHATIEECDPRCPMIIASSTADTWPGNVAEVIDRADTYHIELGNGRTLTPVIWEENAATGDLQTLPPVMHPRKKNQAAQGGDA